MLTLPMLPCLNVLAQAATNAWGVRQLSALEAEDRLSIACEKGLTEDSAMLSLREAYQVGLHGLWALVCGMLPGYGRWHYARRTRWGSLRYHVVIWSSCHQSCDAPRPSLLRSREFKLAAMEHVFREMRSLPRADLNDLAHVHTPQAMLKEYKAVTDAEKADVVGLGGLHVVSSRGFRMSWQFQAVSIPLGACGHSLHVNTRT